MSYINGHHITEFDSWDTCKDYESILMNIKESKDAMTLLNHIKMTQPIFGKWNIVKDNYLPKKYLEYINK